MTWQYMRLVFFSHWALVLYNLWGAREGHYLAGLLFKNITEISNNEQTIQYISYMLFEND